jgi:hypothetical protein
VSELDELTAILRAKLPPYTFRAVMDRVKRLDSDEERVKVLRYVLAEREHGEKADAR